MILLPSPWHPYLFLCLHFFRSDSPSFFFSLLSAILPFSHSLPLPFISFSNYISLSLSLSHYLSPSFSSFLSLTLTIRSSLNSPRFIFSFHSYTFPFLSQSKLSPFLFTADSSDTTNSLNCNEQFKPSPPYSSIFILNWTCILFAVIFIIIIFSVIILTSILKRACRPYHY